MYYPFEAQVAPLVNVRRERMLPIPGDVLVQINERVEPTQVVGRANLPGDFRVLSVARELGVSPSKITRYLLVKLGDEIRRGQVIARSGQTGNVTSSQLHFAIRKGNTPIDPMQYLPSRM